MQEQMEEEEPNDVIPCAGPEEKHEGSSKEVNCTMEDSGLGTAGEDNDCLGKRNADEHTKESVNGEPETQIRAKRKRKKVVKQDAHLGEDTEVAHEVKKKRNGPVKDKKSTSTPVKKKPTKSKKEDENDFIIIKGKTPPRFKSRSLSAPLKVMNISFDEDDNINGHNIRDMSPVLYTAGSMATHIEQLEFAVFEVKQAQDTKLNEIKWKLTDISKAVESIQKSVSNVLSKQLLSPMSAVPSSITPSAIPNTGYYPAASPAYNCSSTPTAGTAGYNPAPGDDQAEHNYLQPNVNFPPNPNFQSSSNFQPSNFQSGCNFQPSSNFQPNPPVPPFQQPSTPDSDQHNASFEIMSRSDLTKWFMRSCSRRNFAANLVHQLFSKEIRCISNVAGRGKAMLDPVKISFVKSTCFEYFPLAGTEKFGDEWQKCVISMDESSRRLNKH